jgi:DNA repair protein RecN (Recombination protein N)
VGDAHPTFSTTQLKYRFNYDKVNSHIILCVRGSFVLAELQIRNFAIIIELAVTFNPGLTVITGETGAGKSILVNAVNLLLGSRGSVDLIRSGSEEASVIALFQWASGAPPEVPENIAQGMDGSEVVVKRALSASGRNRVYINDQLTTVGALTEFCRGLVSISGQHEHQLFLEPKAHLETIDAFGGLKRELETFVQTFDELKKLKSEHRRLQRQAQERKEKKELWSFQVEEIDKARVQLDELIKLEEERERLRHVESFKQGTAMAHQILYSERGAVLEEVSQCKKILTDLGKLDPTLKPLAETLEGISHQVEDVAFSLRDYAQQIHDDPGRMEWVEERLHTLTRLTRKYGGSTRAVLAHAEKLKGTLEAVESDELEIAAKQEAVEKVSNQALALAQKLSKRRRETAERFSKAVEQSLASLDMEKSRFEAVFDVDEISGTENVRVGEYFLNERGLDSVAFFFSANPGEELRPMARIASGGELSRIVLGLKELLAKQTTNETLIFDEVDAGIGGRTADRVGQRLKALARRHQVVCITHLPQIACYGDYHYAVRKTASKERMTTAIKELAGEERLEEIARMLGGEKISAKTRAHAQEMLNQARKYNP